jgi:MFS transporter, CP family, cyanate transporter
MKHSSNPGGPAMPGPVSGEVVQGRTLNKWMLLVLVTLIHLIVVGIPWTVMPVLFTATSADLNLSLGEIGLLWSMLPVGCALTALFGGLLGDRLGFAKTIGIGCFVVAATNGLRGISPNLPILTLAMFLTGAAESLVFPNLQRIPGVFFPRKQVGLATGIVISGFAVGGVLTTALSATVVMPLVGSWRNVLYLYSGLCAFFGIVWILAMRGIHPPVRPDVTTLPEKRPSFGQSLSTVFRVKESWFLSFGNLGVVGAFIAVNGYLPTFLEKIGLSKSVGDTMTSTLFLASILGAIGIPALADRIGGTKAVLVVSSVVTAVVVALLAVANQSLFWVLVPLVGCVTQGVGSLTIVHAVQIKEIGGASAGTVLGLIGGMANVGGFLMPLAGGRLAEINELWPFLLWSLVALSGAVCFGLLKTVKR